MTDLETRARELLPELELYTKVLGRPTNAYLDGHAADVQTVAAFARAERRLALEDFAKHIKERARYCHDQAMRSGEETSQAWATRCREAGALLADLNRRIADAK